jgi:hypothetical protein
MIPKTDKELTRRHDSKNRLRVNQETCMIPKTDNAMAIRTKKQQKINTCVIRNTNP